MALYLVQHGKSLPKDQDPERSLTPEGILNVEEMANIAFKQGVTVSLIKHSGKKRAQQTAEIIAKALTPENGIEESSDLSPMDDVTDIAKKLKSSDDVMLVGHLPFMEKLVGYLITGSEETSAVKFQHGGIVCLDQDSDTGNWIIKWTLFPHLA